MNARIALVAAALALAACTAHTESARTSAEPAQPDAKLLEAVAGEHRALENRTRDRYRHPAETLAFFGIRADMAVVEISPGGGWYTEILAPYLKDEGKLYAAHFPADSEREYFRNSRKKFDAMLAANPEVYGKVEVTDFAPPKALDIAPAGSADMVLTFRNVHNWMSAGSAGEVFRAFHTALKPGGILGVVEHRAPAGAPEDATAPTGYVSEAQVIRLAEQAGFELVDRSEINANPNDTKDHPRGVWTLPPSFALKDVDREKYAAIGESDRMTLKFRKR